MSWLSRAFSARNIWKNVQGSLAIFGIASAVIPGFGQIIQGAMGTVSQFLNRITGGATQFVTNVGTGATQMLANVGGFLNQLGISVGGIFKVGTDQQSQRKIPNWVWWVVGIFVVWFFFFRHHSPSRVERALGFAKPAVRRGHKHSKRRSHATAGTPHTKTVAKHRKSQKHGSTLQHTKTGLKHFKKGSAEAKAHMAKLRAMRAKKHK